MREVKEIPKYKHEAALDPWLTMVLDGKVRELDAADLDGRYKNQRSAASAIRQGATKRNVAVTVSVQGDLLYVHAHVNGAPAKAAAKRTPAKKAAAKRAPAKATAAKRTAKKAAASRGTDG